MNAEPEAGSDRVSLRVDLEEVDKAGLHTDSL